MTITLTIIFGIITVIGFIGAIGSKEKDEANRMTALCIAGIAALCVVHLIGG